MNYNGVRIGIVAERDTSTHRVRVRWPETGAVSDWLHVIRSSGSAWTPAADAVVAVAYLAADDGEGIVLGVVQ